MLAVVPGQLASTMIETCLWAHLTEEHIAELDAAPDEAATRRVLYSALRLTPDEGATQQRRSGR